MKTGAIDDGDIMRGLGFVTMYAAWVEEDIDGILRILTPLEEFTVDIQRFSISRKLKHARAIVVSIERDELSILMATLKRGVSLFKKRNEFIHGRISGQVETGLGPRPETATLRSGRTDKKREITSKDLYRLANEFHAYRKSLPRSPFSELAQVVASVRPKRPPREVRPTHPGEMLRENFLPEYDLTATELATALGVSRQSVNELLRERRAVSTKMALRLAKLFGNSPEFWLNAQRAVDLWDAAKAIKSEVGRIKPLKVV